MKIFMGSFLFWEIFVFDLVLMVSGNAEVDALKALKTNLADPNNVFHTWNFSHPNPCLWFHVTCNKENSVTRLDIESANVSGQLVPQLDQLTNLEYLELYYNNISGRIPKELGNLKNLVSLDLYLNGLTGPIPDSLGNLNKLRFLRLNNNSLSGNIPITLTNVASLQVLDLSNNQLTGEIPVNGSFSQFHSASFASNPGLTPQNVSPSSPSGHSGTGTISGGVAAGVALLFVASAMLGN